nr:hypothetical protein [Symbiopectobacterium purcellii]
MKTGAAYYLVHRPGLGGRVQAEWLTDFLATFTDCLTADAT